MGSGGGSATSESARSGVGADFDSDFDSDLEPDAISFNVADVLTQLQRRQQEHKSAIPLSWCEEQLDKPSQSRKPANPLEKQPRPPKGSADVLKKLPNVNVHPKPGIRYIYA